jgi:hypothetical protein
MLCSWTLGSGEADSGKGHHCATLPDCRKHSVRWRTKAIRSMLDAARVKPGALQRKKLRDAPKNASRQGHRAQEEGSLKHGVTDGWQQMNSCESSAH